jgi:urease accessory protein
MLDATSRFENQRSETVLPAYIRARGMIDASFGPGRNGTTIHSLKESGGYRLKFPHAPICEAIIVNTGGGMAGGDHLNVRLNLGKNAQVMCSTQSAEKIYRSDGAVSVIENRLQLADQAHLVWLPQETILFDRARLRRQLNVNMSSSAQFLACEILVLGRHAMGETLQDAELVDHWDIFRDEHLVYAERLRLQGDLQKHLKRKAVGGGARAIATLLYVSQNAESRLDDLRNFMSQNPEDCTEWGASAWNGLLCLRALSSNPFVLRRVMALCLTYLNQNPLPRVWYC